MFRKKEEEDEQKQPNSKNRSMAKKRHSERKKVGLSHSPDRVLSLHFTSENIHNNEFCQYTTYFQVFQCFFNLITIVCKTLKSKKPDF